MARNQFPGLKTGGGLLSKLLIILLAVLLVLIVKSPADAASWVLGLGGFLGDAADGLVTFLRKVTS